MNDTTQTTPPNVVYLPSTSRGLAGKYIRNTVFLIAGAIGAGMLNSASNSLITEPQTIRPEIIERYGRGEISRNDYEAALRRLEEKNRNGGMSDMDRQAFSWLLFGAAGISGLIAAANGFGLVDNRYRARWVNKVDTERGRITEDKYWFPYGASITDIQIDKITQVDAEQTSIDRMLGTGSVLVQGVVYTAAGSKDVTHTIPYIQDPQAAKTKILEMLLERAGLELKLRDGERIPPVQ